jgi:hypothetical protein
MNWSLSHWENPLLQWCIYESGPFWLGGIQRALRTQQFQNHFSLGFSDQNLRDQRLENLVFPKPGVVLRSTNSEGVHWANMLGLIGQLTAIEEKYLPDISTHRTSLHGLYKENA